MCSCLPACASPRVCVPLPAWVWVFVFVRARARALSSLVRVTGARLTGKWTFWRFNLLVGASASTSTLAVCVCVKQVCYVCCRCSRALLAAAALCNFTVRQNIIFEAGEARLYVTTDCRSSAQRKKYKSCCLLFFLFCFFFFFLLTVFISVTRRVMISLLTKPNCIITVCEKYQLHVYRYISLFLDNLTPCLERCAALEALTPLLAPSHPAAHWETKPNPNAIRPPGQTFLFCSLPCYFSQHLDARSLSVCESQLVCVCVCVALAF